MEDATRCKEAQCSCGVCAEASNAHGLHQGKKLDRLGGYALYRPVEEEDVLQVCQIGIATQHRGRGVTERLIEKLLDEAEKTAIGKIHLLCYAESMSFYESLGFEKLGEVEELLGVAAQRTLGSDLMMERNVFDDDDFDDLAEEDGEEESREGDEVVTSENDDHVKDEFFNSLPKDSFTIKERRLRELIVNSLKATSPVLMQDLLNEKAIQEAEKAVLPPSIPCKEWMDRRVGMEVATATLRNGDVKCSFGILQRKQSRQRRHL